MSRISKGAVVRAAKNVKADGTRIRQWNQLGRWKYDGAMGHVYPACPLIFLEWAGQDYRWVHDNRSRGMCPVCEQQANREYYNQIGYERRLVGEYHLRRQMAEAQQEEDNHGPTERDDMELGEYLK